MIDLRSLAEGIVFFLASNIGREPFNVVVLGTVFSAAHPQTSEGMPDESYLVLTMGGRSNLELWVFDGSVVGGRTALRSRSTAEVISLIFMLLLVRLKI